MSAPVIGVPSISYEAKWPKQLDPALKSILLKVARLFWNIISLIVFPIGLARLAIGAIRNRALRIIVPGNMELDTPVNSYWDFVKVICRFLYNPENFKADRHRDGQALLRDYAGQRVALTAPDQAKLDGAYFPGKIKNKAIIFDFGNGHQWETCSTMLDKLKPLNTSILMINPRGVGESAGTRSEEGYALDIYAAYDFLIKKENIDPNDIVIVGFSMGGAKGTCGAGLVQEEYPDKKINAINIKSFSDLQLEIQTLLQGKGVLASIGRIAAKILPFHLTPKKAWDKLKGEKYIFYDPSDEIIPKAASLVKAVKDHPVGKTEVIKMHRQGHNGGWADDEVLLLQNAIMKCLKINRSATNLGFADLIMSYVGQKRSDLKTTTISQID